MSSRSLNKVQLIGNVTRDPELRYTPQGTPVCSFSIATNRSWLPEGATERREETEFHRLVAWNKLAELCSQLITKGRKVYIEGRLQTRSWETPDGEKRQATEIVIEDMMLLDPRPAGSVSTPAPVQEKPAPVEEVPEAVAGPSKETKEPSSAKASEDKEKEKEAPKEKDKEPKTEEKKAESDEIDLDDIPF